MMTRRQLMGGVLAATQLPAQTRKPNIVWIMGDDLGIGDLGCYGQKHIKTPNIDRIAAEGMQFSDAYSGCTVCAPSRSVLMTGMHMGHTSIRSNPGGVPILPSDVTVAEVLKKAGYATGCYGKWGLGDVGTEGAPWKKGFDEFYGYLHQVHAHWFYPQFLFHNERKDMLPGNENGQRVTYSHDAIAEKALAFIRRNASQPFFCYMPFTIPHLELLVPEDSMKEYRGKLPAGKPYDPPRAHYAKQMEPIVAYAGMVSRLDRTVGQVMALLKELKLDENTIVFFTSDNGGATRLWGEEFFASNAQFRGHKQNFYEGGIRAPMLARWPGKIKAGSKSSHPWYFADFVATAAEIAGVPAPKTDGISVLPVLRGGKTREHEYLYWELPRHDAATGEFRKEAPMQAARKGQWKGVRPKPDGPIEIYNLKDDPAEKNDLAASRADLVKEFTRIFTEAHVHPRNQKNPPQMEFPHS